MKKKSNLRLIKGGKGKEDTPPIVEKKKWPLPKGLLWILGGGLISTGILLFSHGIGILLIILGLSLIILATEGLIRNDN